MGARYLTITTKRKRNNVYSRTDHQKTFIVKANLTLFCRYLLPSIHLVCKVIMSSFQHLARKLHEKSKEFDEHIQSLKKLNDELRDRAGKVLEALNNLFGQATGPKSCNVCYTRPGAFACIPCGHGCLCQSCAQRSLDRTRCFTCRQRVEAIVKIFG